MSVCFLRHSVLFTTAAAVSVDAGVLAVDREPLTDMLGDVGRPPEEQTSSQTLNMMIPMTVDDYWTMSGLHLTVCLSSTKYWRVCLFCLWPISSSSKFVVNCSLVGEICKLGKLKLQKLKDKFINSLLELPQMVLAVYAQSVFSDFELIGLCGFHIIVSLLRFHIDSCVCLLWQLLFVLLFCVASVAII